MTSPKNQQNMSLIKYNRRNPNQLVRFFDDPFTKAFFGENNLNRPAVNVQETEDGYQLEVVAPGRNKDDFKLEVNDQILTVSYEVENNTEEQHKGFTRREYRFDSFKRSFHLDEKIINDEAISASYQDGILRVILPKREEALSKGPKLITVG